MISLDPALADAIRANPFDDSPRLAAAKQMPSSRGDLVIVQCALAKAIGEERVPLERRERELLRDHEEAWTGAWRHAATSWRWSRGFVEEIHLHASMMLAESLTAIGVSEPGVRILQMSLGQQDSEWDEIERVLASGTLSSVRVLRVHEPLHRRSNFGQLYTYENERVCRALAATVDWPLEDLEVVGGSFGTGNRGIAQLARSPMAGALTRLALIACGVNANGIDAISAWSPTLAELDLSRNSLNAAALKALMRSQGLLGLSKLTLDRCSITELSSREIARTRKLPALVELRLSGNTINGEAIGTSSRLSRLSRLDLSNNIVGEAGAIAIATSLHYAELSELDLSGNVLPELAQKRLRDRFGDRVRLGRQGKLV